VLQRLKAHPFIAIVLFAATLLAAFFTFETALLRVWDAIFGRDTDFAGAICDSPEPTCESDNADFVEFLGTNMWGVVTLDLYVTLDAPTDWRFRCDTDNEAGNPLLAHANAGEVIVGLPTDASSCFVANAVQFDEEVLLALGTDGATNYAVSGEFRVAEGRVGPLYWFILRRTN